jgi:hypothetical protein
MVNLSLLEWRTRLQECHRQSMAMQSGTWILIRPHLQTNELYMVSSGYMYDVFRDKTYLNNLENSTFPSFSHHTPPLSYMRSFLFNQLGIG